MASSETLGLHQFPNSLLACVFRQDCATETEIDITQPLSFSGFFITSPQRPPSNEVAASAFCTLPRHRLRSDFHTPKEAIFLTIIHEIVILDKRSKQHAVYEQLLVED
ncbi:hypothetical protein B0H34DRAFT_795406 [Crassisporium funariophilum]|nr:hypothetical protein B0H34DRAFT_795406 [Crassisporium funariophilum]